MDAIQARVLSLLSPKSISTAPRAELWRTLPGLISLCVMPFSWTKTRAEAILSRTWRASAGVPEESASPETPSPKEEIRGLGSRVQTHQLEEVLHRALSTAHCPMARLRKEQRRALYPLSLYQVFDPAGATISG